ncbi:MAG: peptidylprolyl isomerase [Flavobacteriia bacterium]|nr:peptidylprolyl isomerase [Flavobacteriia bacterium]
MQLKQRILKPITKNNLFILFLSFTFSFLGNAQEVLVIDETSNLNPEIATNIKTDTILKLKRYKVDGIAGVVGEYIVLESDIDKTYLELKQQSFSTEGITRCELFGKLLEDKLLAHHAVQDSIVVADSEIQGRTDQQVDYMISQLGSEEKVTNFYRKNSLEEVRKELFEINKTARLASMMQEKIFEGIEITPEETRQFFYAIPEEDRPIFGAELEVAQIVIEPEITEAARKQVINKLKEFRRDIVENGVSFTSRAVMNSQDPRSASRGGLYTINKKSSFAKEFKDNAFSLQEGEVSEPFETEFGFHILKVEKVMGQDREVRHILLIPEVTEETIEAARKKIDNIRNKIVAGEITFAEAARLDSDEKETKNNGGQLINPETFDTRFELTKMDPVLSAQVYNLADGEVSRVIVDDDRTGRKRFKILTVTNRHEEHVADYVKDYEKIKDLALMQKRISAIEKWQKAKIKETYISISKEFSDCEFTNNWTQK